MKHQRWIFILTQKGEILSQELKDKILTQIHMDDHPDEYDYRIMEGDDWLPAYRLGYNIKPNSIIVFYRQDPKQTGYHIFSEPATVEEIRHAMMAAYDTKTSWEVVNELS